MRQLAGATLAAAMLAASAASAQQSVGRGAPDPLRATEIVGSEGKGYFTNAGIPEDNMPVFAARVNRLLKANGRWVNFGSLAFADPGRARRYSPEETKAIVAESGFSDPYVSQATIPYMCSPASRHGRQERAPPGVPAPAGVSMLAAARARVSGAVPGGAAG